MLLKPILALHIISIFFQVVEIIGGGGKTIAPQYFPGGGGGELPPCPPESTPLFAHSLISRLNDGSATLIPLKRK